MLQARPNATQARPDTHTSGFKQVQHMINTNWQHIADTAHCKSKLQFVQETAAAVTAECSSAHLLLRVELLVRHRVKTVRSDSVAGSRAGRRLNQFHLQSQAVTAVV